MGNETWINVLMVLAVAVTAGILLAGCLLLRAMASVRAWNVYLGAVGAVSLALTWVSVKLWSLWDLTREPWNDGGVRSDEIEFAASFQANVPVLCLLVVFVGGLLLGLLGRTAAKQRAAAPRP